MAFVATDNHVTDDNVFILDIHILFQRICMLFNGDVAKTRQAFSYELAPYRLSLFDEKGLIRRTVQSKLYPLLTICNGLELMDTDICYVVDDGWLLYIMIWHHSQKFEQILQLHLFFITNKFKLLLSANKQ